MSESNYMGLVRSLETLKINLLLEEFAAFAMENGFSEKDISAIDRTFSFLAQRKEQMTIDMMLRLSRLPRRNPKTFDNFRFDDVRGKDVDRLRSLPSLSALHAHKNIAFIGPTGTGKTHLAMAFGHECCRQKLKTYFIKMSELNDMFSTAWRFGNEGKVIGNLVKPSCLIVDEVGHCVFDAENTRLFFDLVDRRYNKEGSFNMVFTSNTMPGTWRDKFNEDVSLLCALDRIFDDAMLFKLSGQSHRGKRLETIALTTSRSKLSVSSETSTID